MKNYSAFLLLSCLGLLVVAGLIGDGAEAKTK